MATATFPIPLKTHLHTPRLTLTLLQPADAAHLAYLHQIQMNVATQIYKSPPEQADADARAGVQYGISKGFLSIDGVSLGRSFFWLVSEGPQVPAERFIGLISVIHRTEYPDEGWIIDEEFQGKGYATEAAREVLRYVTDELGGREMWASTRAENATSRAICVKLGMQLTATTVRSNAADGHELVVYMLPGMAPFPQDGVVMRRGDHTRVEVAK